MSGIAAPLAVMINCPLIANGVAGLYGSRRLHAGDCTEAGEAEGDDESFAHFQIFPGLIS